MIHPPKYPSTKHWPWSQTVHRDDSVHPNPENFVGVEVVITEKLDGGNTCLWGGEVYARSTTNPSHAGWMAMVRKYHAWKTLQQPKGMVYYGEDLFGIHSIEYDEMPREQTYRLFATRFVSDQEYDKNDMFQSWDAVEQFADEHLQVPTVPLLFRGSFTSIEEITAWFEQHLAEPSVLGGEREGFVIRHAASFKADQFAERVAKYVRANHVQTDEHWTRNWKECKVT